MWRSRGEAVVSEKTFRVELPKTGAEALVKLAYRNSRNNQALARLTTLLDGERPGRVVVVEVELTSTEIAAVRRAAAGERAPGLGTAAKKAHDALTHFDTYRSGAKVGAGSLRRPQLRTGDMKAEKDRGLARTISSPKPRPRYEEGQETTAGRPCFLPLVSRLNRGADS